MGNSIKYNKGILYRVHYLLGEANWLAYAPGAEPLPEPMLVYSQLKLVSANIQPQYTGFRKTYL